MSARLAATIVLLLAILGAACGGPTPAAAPAPAPAKEAAAPAPAPAKPASQPAAPAQAPAPAAAKPAQMAKVKIGYSPILELLPVFAAKELGHFAQEGIDAELIQFRGGGEITTAMLGRSIDISATTTDRVLVLAEKGQQSKNLVSVINRVLQTVIVRSEFDVKYGDLKALKGRKLGMSSAGSGTDLYLRYYLKQAGLDPEKDVAIIAVGLGAPMVSALETKQIDGANAVEPVTTLAVDVKKIAKPVLESQKDGPGPVKTMPFLSLSATSAWIDANPEVAKGVIRAQKRANDDIRTNPQKGIDVARKYFENLDPQLAEIIVKKQAPYFRSEITEEEMKAAVQLNKEIGVITKDFPYEAVTVGKDMRDLWK